MDVSFIVLASRCMLDANQLRIRQCDIVASQANLRAFTLGGERREPYGSDQQNLAKCRATGAALQMVLVAATRSRM